MEVDGSYDPMDGLLSSNAEKWLEDCSNIKNIVIGNNKQKTAVIDNGILPKLLQLMEDESVSSEIRIEAAVILGSVAKGTENHIQSLIDAGCVQVTLKGIYSNNMKYVEACLRCLRSVYLSNKAPADQVFQDPSTISHLIYILPKTPTTEECITSIFSSCCKSTTHQNILCSNGIVAAVAPLLNYNIYKVQMPTLKCIAVVCYRNEMVSRAVASATFNGEPIPSLLVKLMARNKTSEMQMASAKCLTYLYRSGGLTADNPLIPLKTLPTLVRMCKKDRTLEENIDGAETLAYLIEVDPELQKIASITDHVITTLAVYLKYTDVQQISTKPHCKKDIDWGLEMKQAAFKAFASIGANDEDIRKKIIETENLMDHILMAMNSDNSKVQGAATRCLHSLSRSVQQLRTTFKDHSIWKPLMKLIQIGNDEVLSIASSTLCNLLLEFSPSKEDILESGAINMLCKLAMEEDPALKLNGVWGLMNMAFQSEEKVKSQIVETLGAEQLFVLLSDDDATILMKTLGLLRNLLSNKPHIDSIMSFYGTQVMQAVVFILEGDHSIDIKEQTLCILANIADGDRAKDYIMENEDVLKKLMSYMNHSDPQLQIAATYTISNLVWNDHDDVKCYRRQEKLRELGVQKILQKLLDTPNQTLFEKVKTALQQFS
ncbi:hypothetical protein LOTGIDRAFT_201652 [Lottia gigantea]|uniref:Armadillo repeat-containing protein 8 n=1 Tax=Lottia gigantea TaxID=225164 RepID=V4A3P3_LOTGI|nr:hypothetical protein LOTGIDRAFT_201652 [Lottia gigantea]ESO98508.1 hypothetical protein LOTGIDRAFT_201652 [Lottia gigantea]